MLYKVFYVQDLYGNAVQEKDHYPTLLLTDFLIIQTLIILLIFDGFYQLKASKPSECHPHSPQFFYLG